MRPRHIIASPLVRLLAAATLPLAVTTPALSESLLSPIFRAVLGQRKPSEKVTVNFIGNSKLHASALREAIEEQLSRIASQCSPLEHPVRPR